MKNEIKVYLDKDIKIKHNKKGCLHLENFEVFLRSKIKFGNKAVIEKLRITIFFCLF